MKSKMLSIALSVAIAFGAWGIMPSRMVFAAASENAVVINEFVVNPTTGKEYVELLVTAPGGVDMQGWTISDVSSRAGTTSATEGDISLPASAAYLSSVPQGTYVIVVLTTPAANSNTLTEDTTLDDGNNVLVLIAGTTAGLTLNGTIDFSTNDNIQVYAGTRAAGTLIDQVLWGNNTSYISGATWGDNNSGTTTDNINAGAAVTSNSAVRFVPSGDSLTEFQNNDTGTRFTVDGTSYGTPGTINTGVAGDSAVTNPSYSSSDVPAGSYTGLTIAGNVNLLGGTTTYLVLTLNADLTTNANVLTLARSSSVTGNGDVIGTVSRVSPATGTPLTFNNAQTIITFNTAPTQMDVTLAKTQGFSFSIPRTYTLTPTGPVNADIQLAYKPSEATANEAGTKLLRYDGANWVLQGGTVNMANLTWHWVSLAGVTTFSPWTLSAYSPTAITLTSFSGHNPTNDGWIVAILFATAVLLVGGWMLRRRTQA